MNKLPEANHLKIEVMHFSRSVGDPAFYALRVYDPATDSVLVYGDEKGATSMRCYSRDDLMAHLQYALSILPDIPEDETADEENSSKT